MTAAALLGSLALYKAFLALAAIVSGALTTPVFSRVDVFYYAFPFQAATLIFAFLLPDPVTLVFIILNSLTAGLLVGGDFVLTIFSFVGGLAAVYGVKLYRKRYRAATLRAGFIVLPAVNALLILAFHLILKRSNFASFPAEVAMGVLGGTASAVLAFMLLPLVESAFGFVTGSKLLELTNSDLPIFRQLSEEAPGSYHHSLIVASLAEKAAEELGLDAQLAKAGALYHDIGKTKMPEYFIENRTREFDLHKDLTPSMSTLVIKNHVKEGAELARRLKLPRPLREIIEQHHGNSLVRYFYAKAKQTYDPDGTDRGRGILPLPRAGAADEGGRPGHAGRFDRGRLAEPQGADQGQPQAGHHRHHQRDAPGRPARRLRFLFEGAAQRRRGFPDRPLRHLSSPRRIPRLQFRGPAEDPEQSRIEEQEEP